MASIDQVAAKVHLALTQTERRGRIVHWNVRKEEEKIVKAVRESLKSVNLTGKKSSGVYRFAFVMNKFVVKFSRDTYRQDRLVFEYALFKQFQKSVNKNHFPDVRLVKVNGWVALVQERVNTSDNWKRNIRLSDRQICNAGYARKEIGRNIGRLGTVIEVWASNVLGIWDMHLGNWGVKKIKNKFIPVLFDIDLVGRMDDPHNYEKYLHMEGIINA